MKHTDESKAKLRASWTPERRQRASRRFGTPFESGHQTRRGQTLSEESRARISAKLTGRPRSTESRVRQSQTIRDRGPLPPTGICEICHREAKLVGDHNHQTGIDRGRLCRVCNSALGFFLDDIDVLRRAVAYLEKYDD